VESGVTVRGRPAPLTRAQEFDVRQARGAERRYQLEQLINGAAFPRMSEDNQRRAVERVMSDASAAVTRRAGA
jgi:hypothetical protein